MKVLVFTTQFYLCSGAERLSVELAIDLNRCGVHADLLSLYDDTEPGVVDKSRELQNAGVPELRFLGLSVNPSISSVLRAIANLRRLIQIHNYDIVETSQLSPAVIAAWATIGTNCRHLGGIHAVFRRGVRESFQLKIWRLTAQIVRTSHYYAISSYVAKSWARYTGLDLNGIHLIHNGINDAAFMAQPDRENVENEFDLPPDSRIILFVGRLDQFKGVDTALDAVGPLLKQKNLVLIYIGHEERTDSEAISMLDTVFTKVRDEGWNSRVRFLGRREDVFRLMASSDILVHPARTEGFGLVLAEAMAIGLPIVASHVDGIPEVLSGSAAILIPPNDPMTLRESVLHVLDWNSTERSLAIQKGRRRAADFRTNKRTMTMIKVMQELIYQGNLS